MFRHKGLIVRTCEGEEIERQRVLCGETRLLRTGIVRVLQSTECPRSVCGEGAGEEEQEARGLCGMNCAWEGVLSASRTGTEPGL